jgi:hypothetical protein
VADAAGFSDRMAELQRLRVAVVILLSQENSRLLSRRQRVAGKEIEVMCAERDLQSGGNSAADRDLRDTLIKEETAARAELQETEREIAEMETLMARIDMDIAALCQS